MANNTKGRVPTGFADEIVISEASFRSAHRARESAAEPPAKKLKREEKGDASIVYGKGAYKGPWARYEMERPDAASEEEGSDVEIVYEEDEIEEQPAAPATKEGTDYETDNGANEKTIFHGSALHDYQGRTYMHVPQDLGINLKADAADVKNYIPKKLVHTWKHHTKAINALRFFPDSGHLLLSASADNTVKIWDVYHQRELLRTYMGHSKSVNDICFNNDGTRFLSASYDRQMKLWDTETGQCVTRFSTGKTPHVVRFNPDPALNHQFLAGMADKKIVQFDTRSGKLEQEYDHHLGPVNTITFCDENRRFITTSDDKSLRAWEYGIRKSFFTNPPPLPPPAVLTTRPSRPHQIHRRALHVPHGALRTSPVGQIRRLPIERQPNRRVRMHRPVPPKPQKELPRAQQRRVRGRRGHLARRPVRV